MKDNNTGLISCEIDCLRISQVLTTYTNTGFQCDDMSEMKTIPVGKEDNNTGFQSGGN